MGQRVPSGSKTISVSNTPERVSTTSVNAQALLLTAAESNAETVKVGDSAVGASSYPLLKGNSLAVDTLDPASVYVYGKAGDVIYWIAVLP